MKKLAGELRDLTPALLSTTLPAPTFQPADAPIDTMMKASDGSLYVFAVNHDKAAHSVTFMLPKSAAANAEVQFENRTVRAQRGLLTDDFAPLEVHVYKLAVK